MTLNDEYLPKSAVDTLVKEGIDLTDEQNEYLSSHYLEIDEYATESTSVLEESEFKITGSTTFSEVIGLGVSEKEIESIIGEPIPALNMAIKDYCVEKEIPFSEIKDKLNSAIASK